MERRCIIVQATCEKMVLDVCFMHGSEYAEVCIPVKPLERLKRLLKIVQVPESKLCKPTGIDFISTEDQCF